MGINKLRNKVYRFRLKRQFPKSIIHDEAMVDSLSWLGDYSVIFRNGVLMNTVLGAYSYVQSNSVICNTEIGNFCSIASGVNIGLGVHPTHMVSTSPVFYDNAQPLPRFFVKERIFKEVLPRTMIGADVWIGQGALVKAGVTIGVGAVIGAGAIVTKNVPPYTIAAGNPCKPIRNRFPGEKINKLIDSKWWLYEDDILYDLAEKFNDIDNFIIAVNEIH